MAHLGIAEARPWCEQQPKRASFIVWIVSTHDAIASPYHHCEPMAGAILHSSLIKSRADRRIIHFVKFQNRRADAVLTLKADILRLEIAAPRPKCLLFEAIFPTI